MALCAVCNSTTGKQERGKVQCGKCKKWNHVKCVGLTSTPADWRCINCTENTLIGQGDIDSSAPSLENMMKLLLQLTNDVKLIKSDQRNQEHNLGKSLDLCHEKLDSNAALLTQQQQSIERCLGEIDALKSENKLLRTHVQALESRVTESEQYSRRNTVEIYGVPESRNEDVLTTVQQVGRAINIDIHDNMIDICHRLPKQQNQQHGGIIVKFVRRIDKERFMDCRRIKRNLSTRHLGLPEDAIIYVNESLSQEKRRLLAQARKVKRDKQFEFLWVRNGVIKMKKTQGTRVIIINNSDDLATIQ